MHGLVYVIMQRSNEQVKRTFLYCFLVMMLALWCLLTLLFVLLARLCCLLGAAPELRVGFRVSKTSLNLVVFFSY